MIINRKNFRAFVNSLASEYNLVAPSDYRFKRVHSFDEIMLDGKTVFSAKHVFFPQKEALLYFRGKEIIQSARPTVLFGVRPCDMNAIAYTDLFFRGDPYYEKKRESTIILGLQCTRPFKNCYCHLTDTFESSNYDALFIESKNDFFIDAKTEKGRDIVKRLCKNLCRVVGEKEIETLMNLIKQNFIRKNNAIKINDKVIERFSKDCYSCTMCTSVCPTCTCFDIEDEMGIGRPYRRVRKWDSCQTQPFTRVAGEFVFRETRLSRVRQRIYCKFDYSKKNHGMLSCTGCGRCIPICNKEINIFEAVR